MQMNGNKSIADLEYVCPEEGCRFHWRVQDGYFQVIDGTVHYPPDAHQFLKLALVREHGYLYIASVEGSPQKRTWRCAVKDCPNAVVDEV
jgi:hypothetical protein